MGKRKKAILLTAAAIAAPTLAHAQVSGSWINRSSGTWSVAPNWSSNPFVPGGGGNAVLPDNRLGNSTITLDSDVTLSELSFLGEGRYSITGGGKIILDGPLTLNVPEIAGATNSFTMIGQRIFSSIGGTGSITKTGDGMIQLTGTNTFVGGITINAGTVGVSATGLGSPPNAVTLNGGVLHYQSSGTWAVPLTVGSAGGTLTSSSSYTIGADITGNSALALGGNGPFRTVSVTQPLSFAGNIDARDILSLSGNGKLLNIGGLTIYNELILSNSSPTDRIADNASLLLRGGRITSQGGSGPATEQLGQVTLDRGHNAITVDDTGKFEMQSLLRSNRSAAVFEMPTTGDIVRITGTPPTLSGGALNTPQAGIVPWLHHRGGPVTVDANRYIRPLKSSEKQSGVPSGVTNANFSTSSTVVLSNPATVNSLTSFGTLTGSATITVNSGAIFLPDAFPVLLEAPIHFGAAEGIIHNYLFWADESEIRSNISGSNGLTLDGRLAIKGDSTYTGTTTILASVRIFDDVIAGQSGPFGADTSPVVIDMGTIGMTENASMGHWSLRFVANSDLQFTRGMIIRNFAVTEALGPTETLIDVERPSGSTSNGVEISGDIQIEGSVKFRGAAGATLTLSGNISGPGILYNPAVILSGNNTFSGGVDMEGSGHVGVASDTAFGTGRIWLSSATMYGVGGPRTIGNPMSAWSSATFIGDQPLAFTGKVDLVGQTTTFTFNNTATTTFATSISDGTFRKSGAGMAEAQRMHVTSFQVLQGPMRILPRDPDVPTSVVGALSVSSGASLDLTNNDFIIDHTGTSPAPTIRQMLLDGRLFTSTGDSLIGLGYGENSLLGFTTFSGQQVDSTSLLIKYTYKGDADLDGDVDAADLGRVGLNWLATGGWTEGDFNYNGIVDVLDVYLLAQNWGAPPITFELAMSQALSIPEPSTSLALATILFLPRRKRH